MLGFPSEDCFGIIDSVALPLKYIFWNYAILLDFPETFTKFEDIEDWHPFGRPFKPTIDYSWIILSSKYGL